MKEIPNTFLVEYHDPFSVWSEIEPSMHSLLPFSLNVSLDNKSFGISASCLYISSKKLEECGRMSTLHFLSEHPYLHLFIIPPMHSDVYKEIKDDIKAWIKEKRANEWFIIYGLCKRELVEDQKINSKTIEKIKRKLLNMGHRSTRLLFAPMVNLKCIKSEKGKPLVRPITAPRVSDSPPESTISLYKDWDDIKELMELYLKDAVEYRHDEITNSLEKYKFKSLYTRRESTEMSYHLKMANLKENLLHLYLKCGLWEKCIDGYSELLSGRLAKRREPQADTSEKASDEKTSKNASDEKETKSTLSVHNLQNNRSFYSITNYPANGEISEDIFRSYTKFRVSLPTTSVSPFQFKSYILAKQLVVLWHVNTMNSLSKAAELAMEFAMQKVDTECKGMFIKFLFDMIYQIESKLTRVQDTEKVTPLSKKKVSNLASSALLDCSSDRIKCYRCLAFLYRIVHGLQVDECYHTAGAKQNEKLPTEASNANPEDSAHPTQDQSNKGPTTAGKESNETPEDASTAKEAGVGEPTESASGADGPEEKESGGQASGEQSEQLAQEPAPAAEEAGATGSEANVDGDTTTEETKTLQETAVVTVVSPGPEDANDPAVVTNEDDKETPQETADVTEESPDQETQTNPPSNVHSTHEEVVKNEKETVSLVSEEKVDSPEVSKSDNQPEDGNVSSESQPTDDSKHSEDKKEVEHKDENKEPLETTLEAPLSPSIQQTGEPEEAHSTVERTTVEDEPTVSLTNDPKDNEDNKSVSCITDCSVNPSDFEDSVEANGAPTNGLRPKGPEHIPKFAFEICLPLKVADQNEDVNSKEGSPGEKGDEPHLKGLSSLKPKREFEDSSELLERSCTYFTLGGLYRHSVLVDPVVKGVLSKLKNGTKVEPRNTEGVESNNVTPGGVKIVDTNLAFLEKDTRMMGWTHLWSIVKSVSDIQA